MAIYATSLIMFALPISMSRFKSINFYQNIPKIKLKNAIVLVCWGLLLHFPVPPAAGGLAPRPPKQPPIANFWLRTRCFYCCYVIWCKLILLLASVSGFAQVALALNKFAHPWLIIYSGHPYIQIKSFIILAGLRRSM